MKSMRWIKRCFIILFALLFVFCAGAQFRNQYAVSQTPTLFVHGYRGGAQSMADIIESLQRKGAGRQVMTITISKTGRLSARGFLNEPRNPLIKVIFKNNTAGEVMYTKWLLQVMRYLKTAYGIEDVNLVGHSMGAYASIASAMQKPALKVQRMVVIAGPYDGIMHWNDEPHVLTLKRSGEPSKRRPEYRRLLKRRKDFDAQAVLNIYGDVNDGSNSDTVVTTASALSLRYVLRNFKGAYAEQEISGSHAEHSLLHIGNRVVNSAVASFLWGYYPMRVIRNVEQ